MWSQLFGRVGGNFAKLNVCLSDELSLSWRILQTNTFRRLTGTPGEERDSSWEGLAAADRAFGSRPSTKAHSSDRLPTLTTIDLVALGVSPRSVFAAAASGHVRNRRRQTRLLHIAGAVCSALAMFACNSPARPSVTVVAGRPTSPAQDAALSYYSQPITLVVTPGVTATGAPPTTVLEVATDGAFASIVVTKTLPPVNGQSTATLDHLSAATTYYWRVKTTAGDSPSIVSATSSFSIGPQLVIQAPTPVTPLADTFPHKRPTFTAANAIRTGPSATLTYRFEIASDGGFNTLIASATIAETPDQTSFMTTGDLNSGRMCPESCGKRKMA